MAARVSTTKEDKKGAWCPHCGNRNSWRETKAGCFYTLLCLLTLGGALLFWPLLPRTWHCNVCENEWKA